VNFADFIAQLVDPRHILTQLPYVLLILSMLMADIGWLRAVAILAGIAKIVDRGFINSIDPVVVFWEAMFVLVNVVQLAILLYYRRRHRFSEDEAKLVAVMPRDVERHALRRLFRLSKIKHAEPGDLLTKQGEPVTDLIFIAEGVAQVERDKQMVAVCGPGDFIGEMSFVAGGTASATVVAARPMRYFAFEQQRLRQAQSGDSELKRALEACLARNLVGKLNREQELPGRDPTPA
jgi:CRP-like cAMP-binding protein